MLENKFHLEVSWLSSVASTPDVTAYSDNEYDCIKGLPDVPTVRRHRRNGPWPHLKI